MSYRIFTRRWWKDNPAWPNGLEPDGNARKQTRAYVDTEEQAREWCKEWNDTHDPGKYSTKAEYEGG